MVQHLLDRIRKPCGKANGPNLIEAIQAQYTYLRWCRSKTRLYPNACLRHREKSRQSLSPQHGVADSRFSDRCHHFRVAVVDLILQACGHVLELSECSDRLPVADFFD